MHAGQDLDQRRLAGAVVADQRHDLAGVDVEIDVGQGRDGAEVLGDAAQAQHEFARRVLSAGVRHRPASRHSPEPMTSGRRVGGRTELERA